MNVRHGNDTDNAGGGALRRTGPRLPGGIDPASTGTLSGGGAPRGAAVNPFPARGAMTPAITTSDTDGGARLPERPGLLSSAGRHGAPAASPLPAPANLQRPPRLTRRAVAEMMHISERYIYYSTYVARHAIPEMSARVKAGEPHLSLYTGYLLAHLDAQGQRDALALPWRERIRHAYVVRDYLRYIRAGGAR